MEKAQSMMGERVPLFSLNITEPRSLWEVPGPSELGRYMEFQKRREGTFPLKSAPGRLLGGGDFEG